MEPASEVQKKLRRDMARAVRAAQLLWRLRDKELGYEEGKVSGQDSYKSSSRNICFLIVQSTMK